jgi:hypothetical protein
MLMSRHQNAKLANRSFGNVANYKYLETTTKKNSVALVRKQIIPTERPPLSAK